MSSTDDLVAKFWAQQGKSAEEQGKQQSEAQSAAPAGGSGSDVDDLAAKFWAQQGGGPAPARQPDPAPVAAAAVNALTAGLGKLRGGMFNRQAPAAPATPAAPVPAAQQPTVLNPRAATTATLNRFRQSEIGNQLGAARAQQQAADQELKNSWLNMLGYVPQPGLIPNAEQAMQQAQAGDRLAAAMQSSRDAGAAVKQLQEDANRARNPEIYRYEARRDEATETQREVQRLQSIVDGSTGVKQDDGSIFLPDGTILAPGQAERELKVARDLLDVQNKTAEEEFDRIPKGQQLAEKNPALGVAWSGLRQGFAGLSRVSSGVLNALFGKDGVLGWFAQEAGGMFADGVNNLLHMDLIDAEKIRSGDWNPISKLDNANRKAVQQLQNKAVRDLGARDGMVTASQIVGNTIQMLPLFYLQAYAQALPAASGAAGTTGGVQYAANLGTATSGAQQANIMFNHAARMMAQDPATQYTFLQSFGSSYNEAKEDGADNAHAIVYALLNASINTGIEMGGGIERLPAEMQGVEALSKRGVMAMADSVVDEVKEEVAQGFFEKGLKAVYQDVDLYSDTNEDAMINPGRMGREALMAGAGTLVQIPVQRAAMGSMALLGNVRRGRNGGGISAQVQETEEARRAVEDASPYRETGEGNAQAAQEAEYTRADFDEDAESEEAPTVTASREIGGDTSPGGGGKSGTVWTAEGTGSRAEMEELERLLGLNDEGTGSRAEPEAEAAVAASENSGEQNSEQPAKRESVEIAREHTSAGNAALDAALGERHSSAYADAEKTAYRLLERFDEEGRGLQSSVSHPELDDLTRFLLLDIAGYGPERTAKGTIRSTSKNYSPEFKAIVDNYLKIEGISPEFVDELRSELEQKYGDKLRQSGGNVRAALNAVDFLAEEASRAAMSVAGDSEAGLKESQVSAFAKTVLLEMTGLSKHELPKSFGGIFNFGNRYRGVRENDFVTTTAEAFEDYHPETAAKIRQELERRFGGTLTHGAQNAAGAQENAQGEITPQSAQETSQEASERLNPQEPQSGGIPQSPEATAPFRQGGQDAAQGGQTAQPMSGAQALADAALGRSPEITAKPEKKTAKPKSSTAAARELKSEIGYPTKQNSLRDGLDDIAGALTAQDGRTEQERVADARAKARSLAEDILDQEAGNTGEQSAAKDLKDYLKRTKLNISNELRAERADWNIWLRSMFGKFRLVKEGGLPIDSAYQELQNTYGEGLFPSDVLNQAEMLDTMLSALAKLEGQSYTFADELGDSYERALDELTEQILQKAADMTGRSYDLSKPQLTEEEKRNEARERAIESQINAYAFDGEELSREEAERLVDQFYDEYGVYGVEDLEENNGQDEEDSFWDDEYGWEEENGEESFDRDDGEQADEDAELDRALREAETTDEGADAGSSEELSADERQGTPAGGPAEAEPGGAGEVRGPGSAAPDGEVSGETEERRAVEDAGPYGEGEYTRADFDEDAETETESSEKPQEGPKQIPNGAKLSKFWEHTLQSVEEAKNAPDEVKQPLWYMPKSEVQSLAEASSRLDEDTQGTIEELVKSEAWSGVQYDAATMVADKLYAEAMETEDFSGYSAWRLVMKDHVGDTARGLQAVKKSTRFLGRNAVDSVVDQMEESDVPKPVKDRVITEAAQYGKELDGIKAGDTDSLKDLVKRLAKRRKNWTLFDKNMDALLNRQSEEWLRNAAARQINALGRDARNRGFRNMGAKIASYHVLSMLSGLPTVGGNIVGNASFGNLFDLFAEQGPGRAIDALLGNLTGQRTVVGSRGPVWETVPEWWKNATKLMQTSLLETALDIDTDSDMKRPMEMPASSTFIADSNPVERLFQRWSQFMSYALVGTDRFSRGGIEGGETANYEAFDEKMAAKGKRGTGHSEQERNDLVKGWADYRLFQNKTAVSDLQKTIRRSMNNLLGIGGEKDASGKRTKDNTFGLGSVVMPFVEVPTNLALKTFEWGPGNLVAAAKDFGKLLWAVHQNSQAEKTGSGKHVSTAELQLKTAMEAARGLSGTAFIALAAMLARLGLIKNEDDEEDYDVSAVNKTAGQKGTQINISGISRASLGGSIDWQPGDITIGMDRIQPLNMWLKAGVLINDVLESDGWWEKSTGGQFADLSKAYLQASADSILEMPLFQNMQNMTNTLRNAEKFEWGLVGDLAGTALDNQMSSLVPQAIRQSARAADPYVRDTASDSWLQQRANNALQYIPGARNTLPAKVDSFGEPMEQQGADWERWLNGLVSPVSVTTYKGNDVVDMLAGLREETGKANFYPNRKPPKAVDLPAADGNDKESVTLNTEQKRAYQETYGKAYTGLMESFIASDEWKNLSASDRKKILEQAESLATDLAKRQLAESLGRPYSSDWDDELQNIPSEYLPDYLETKQSFKSAIKEKDFDAVDALLGNMGKHDDVVTGQLYEDVSRLDDRAEAYEAGIKTATWERAYEAYRKINNAEGLTATEKAIKFAQYLDSGKLSKEKQDLLREQFGFYNISRGKTDTFDKLAEDAGLGLEKAAALYDTMKNLEPLPGNKGVTQNQKILTLSGYRDLSEKEKWAALKTYVSDACYKKAMEAKAKGQSFDEWAREYTKGK